MVANKRARQAWAALEAETRIMLARDAHENELDPHVAQESLRSLFTHRQTALAAYEGEDAEG